MSNTNALRRPSIRGGDLYIAYNNSMANISNRLTHIWKIKNENKQWYCNRAVMFSFTTCTLVEWPKGLPCGITVARPFRSITGRCKLLLDLSDISIIVYLNRGQDREGRKNRED